MKNDEEMMNYEGKWLPTDLTAYQSKRPNSPEEKQDILIKLLDSGLDVREYKEEIQEYREQIRDLKDQTALSKEIKRRLYQPEGIRLLLAIRE